MELSRQVTNLELSMRLNELGVPQKSLFVWEYFDQNCYGLKYIPFAVVPSLMNHYELFSAFSVAELIEFLGAGIHIETNNVINYPDIKKYLVLLSGSKHHVIDNDLCASLAKMLIHLIENGLIKVEDLK